MSDYLYQTLLHQKIRLHHHSRQNWQLACLQIHGNKLLVFEQQGRKEGRKEGQTNSHWSVTCKIRWVSILQCHFAPKICLCNSEQHIRGGYERRRWLSAKEQRPFTGIKTVNFVQTQGLPMFPPDEINLEDQGISMSSCLIFRKWLLALGRSPFCLQQIRCGSDE